MRERQRIPVELAEIPPGPELSAALDAIDPGRLSGPDCVALLKARARQVAHEQARFLATMVQVGLCDPDAADDGHTVARLDEPPQWAADEVRAALVWTRRAADTRYWDAHDLITRLPQVHHALDAGWIDMPRAKVLAEWTAQLTVAQAHRVCDALLPLAPELTTGQLIARIKQMAIAIDPGWAERKYTEALKTRRVVGYRNPDGTANVSGLDLPVDRAAAACGRIDAMARRVKQAGDRRPIDMIRADIYLGMLDGTYEGWAEQDIIEHLLTTAGACDDTERSEPGHGESGRDEPDRDRGEHDRGKPVRGESARGGSRVREPARAEDTHDASHASEAGYGDRADGGQTGGGPSGREPSGGEHCGSAHDGAYNGGAAPCGSGDMADAEAQAGSQVSGQGEDGRDGTGGSEVRGSAVGGSGDGAEGSPRGVITGVDLQVKLSTLLCLDEHPAEIAGWAFTHAGVARAIAARQTGAQWRYTVGDENGALLAEGLITGRPSCYPKRMKLRGGSVEVLIPVDLLHRLAAEPGAYPAWAAVIGQISTDAAASLPPTTSAASGHQADTGPPRQLVSDSQRAGADEDTEPQRGICEDWRRLGGGQDGWPVSDLGDQHGGDIGDRGDDLVGDRRFPGARLRRRVRAKDRTCRSPGCRMPAATTDTDHNRQWRHDGRTLEHNLASLCRHDHRLKDEGGWSLTRTEAGVLLWTSPLGLIYRTPHPPIIVPLPDPQPRTQHPISPRSMTADANADEPIWWEPRTGSPVRDDDGSDRQQDAPPAGTPDEVLPF